MPPHRRTKTFTGCWTCRVRKLKCDEGRPYCRQCRSKSLKCEGYGARLQWLSPETGSSPDRMGRGSHAIGLRWRCLINPEILDHVLSESEIEALLEELDASNATQDPLARSSPKISGPFGVFDAKQKYERHVIAAPTDLDLDASLNSLDSISAGAYSQVTSSPNRCLLEGVNSSHWQSSPDTCCDPTDILSFSGSPLLNQEDSVDIDSNHTSTNPPTTDDIVFSNAVYSAIDKLDFQSQQSPFRSSSNAYFSPGSWEPAIISIPKLPSGPQTLSEQEKYLMHHYMNRVVHCFAVISNHKSPWKTQHLPRALQAAGELDVTGSTSRIRLALLRTLLSISAFVLSNEYRSHGQDEMAASWRQVASTLRSQAILLLQSAIETDLCSPGNPKYKEFLATMLSMITINVMSGDTATCSVHLAGCLQLIRHTAKRKTNFSAKARALHRIYFYLQTIYQSTRVWGQYKVSAIVSHPAAGVHTIDNVEDAVSQDETQWLDLGEGLPCDLTATEFIYGVPMSLFVLLRKITGLIESLPPCNPYTREFERSPGWNHSSQQCDDIEREILDWSCEAELAKFASAADTKSYEIIKQYTVGFHNALIIYFSQHIRLISFRYLRPYVERVLDCMETIENIKTSSEILAGPIFWPMFIAASEAFDESLQQRCRTWFDRVDVYNVGAARIGNEIIEEVWRRSSEPMQFSTSLWRVVVEDSGRTLMLT